MGRSQTLQTPLRKAFTRQYRGLVALWHAVVYENDLGEVVCVAERRPAELSTDPDPTIAAAATYGKNNNIRACRQRARISPEGYPGPAVQSMQEVAPVGPAEF